MYIREIVNIVVDFIAIHDTFSLSCVNRGMFRLLRQKDAYFVYQKIYCDTELLVDNLTKIVSALWSYPPGPVGYIHRIKKSDENFDNIIADIERLHLPTRFIPYVWARISNNVCTHTDFMRAIVCGDIATIKRIQPSFVADRFMLYLVAIILGQCEIVKIFIDQSLIKPLWNEGYALKFACITQDVEMVDIVIHHHQQFMSGEVSAYGTQETDLWEMTLIKCARDSTSLDVCIILINELKKRVSPVNFYSYLIRCFDYDHRFFVTQPRLRMLYDVSCQVFDNKEDWIDIFMGNVTKNLTSGYYAQVKELFEIEGVIQPQHKHKLLGAIHATRYRKQCDQPGMNEFIRFVLDDKRFTWDVDKENVNEELECFDNDRIGCYELLRTHSNYTRKFLREHNVPPEFFARSFRLLSWSADIDTWRYVLDNKTSQIINYQLANVDVCNDIYHVNTTNAMPILKMLLDDDRVNFSTHDNKFLKRLITDDQFAIISLLIDSGKMGFPSCIGNLCTYDYCQGAVQFFAEHETYFKQIIEQFKDSDNRTFFVRAVINFHK